MGVQNSDSGPDPPAGGAPATGDADPATGDADPATENGWAVPADEGAVAAPSPGASDLERRLWDAVDEIPDPHIPVSLVEMGMVYDVRADDGDVTVELTYPCMGCPAYDMIQNDVRSRLRVVEGVDSVAVEVVWDPVWSKDLLTERAREGIREAGIGL